MTLASRPRIRKQACPSQVISKRELADLHRGAIDHRRAVRLLGEARGRDQLVGAARRRASRWCLLSRRRSRSCSCASSPWLVVQGDVVVGILPGRRGRRRAALERAGCSRSAPTPGPCRIVDQQLAVVVDQLDVVGVAPVRNDWKESVDSTPIGKPTPDGTGFPMGVESTDSLPVVPELGRRLQRQAGRRQRQAAGRRSQGEEGPGRRR